MAGSAAGTYDTTKRVIMYCMVALSVLSYPFGAWSQPLIPAVSIDWNDVIATSRTTTTLQVVANAVLNPTTSPVAAAFFDSLATLDAEYVRYVPWFPYPSVGVAELEPPDYATNTTSWDFTNILPQLTAFMNATYRRGHKVVPNFSTQPTWMYSTDDWSYPSDPNVVDWNYPQGSAYANTTANVAAYYARLLSWLVKGTFVDEFGVTHVGGPQYNLTHWEVFNEPDGCHGLDVQGYTVQYDAVVTAIREAADPEHFIQFVGLALQYPDTDVPSWVAYFLNASNHQADIPLDYISFHFYGFPSSRTDASTFEELFPAVDAFIPEAQNIVDIRDALSPLTKLSCDEMGVVLPDDNDNNAVPIPSIYWNAAGAMYAYLVGQMTVLGYDILGASQLAGSPPIPEWDIPDAQFPSVTLVNWTTGAGNARYWILKLLIDEFAPGDQLVMTSCPEPPQSNPLCGVDNGEVDGYGNVTIQCADPNAVISDIDFAAFGTPSGTCGNYEHNASCDASGVMLYVTSLCVGNNNCSVLSFPTFGDPCFGTFKSLVIQAECSGSMGGWATPPANGTLTNTPYAQAYITSSGYKLLLVNKFNSVTMVTVANATNAVMQTVDESCGDGPAYSQVLDNDTVTMAPFAVAVITFASSPVL